MDSMAAIEVRYALKAEFGLELPTFFTSCSTPRAIQAYVSGAISTPKVAKPFPVALMPSANLKKLVPFESSFYSPGPFLMHVSIASRRLCSSTPSTTGNERPTSPLLLSRWKQSGPVRRPIWGIHNHRFIDAQPWDGMVDMAAAYVEYVLSVTSGPLLLGGALPCRFALSLSLNYLRMALRRCRSV
ncbi:hypothetical protein B0H12DRAFT_798807 [Mycena haematopus]|nr:hypothetical protein B0H12DRAFT_798807 [Mycena haematopus]